MAVNEHKEAAKAEITDWLRGKSDAPTIESLRARHTKVSRATWFRILKECRETTGIQSPVIALAAEHAREISGEPQPDTGASALNRLPVPVVPQSVSRYAGFDAFEILRQGVLDADEVQRNCRDKDGRIRNQKMFLFASAQKRACVDSAARVAERINDAQRIHRVHEIIFEEVRKESPECADRIMERIGKVLDMFGAQ